MRTYSSKEFYHLLNVHRGELDMEQLRYNYKRAVKENHPDQFTDPSSKDLADRRMALINEAFRVLADPNERILYDLWLQKQADPEPIGRSTDNLEKYVPSDTPEMDFVQGMSAMLEGMVEKAIYYFKWAIFKNPRYYAAQYFLGRAYLMMESSYEQVGRHYIEDALQNDPSLAKFGKDGWAIPKVGGLYMRLHRSPGATESRETGEDEAMPFPRPE